MESTATEAKRPDQKYCTDCGKLILLRAEICPGCGCRQMPVVSVDSYQPPADPLTKPMILLFVLNFLWNGLGNIAIGDRRGWNYGFINWLFVLASVFLAGLPIVIFYAYCGFQGYRYVSAIQLYHSTSNTM